MKGLLRILLSIVLSVAMLVPAKTLFNFDESWFAVVVTFGVPSFIFWALYDSDTVTGTSGKKVEKIVNLQTNEVTDETFDIRSYPQYQLSFTLGDDKTYSTSSGQVMITRMVSETFSMVQRTPVFPWIVYVVLSGTLGIMFWIVIVRDGTLPTLFTEMLSRFQLPWK